MLEKLIAFSGCHGTRLIPSLYGSVQLLAIERPRCPRTPRSKAYATEDGVELDFVSGMEFQHGCAVPAIDPSGEMGWVNPFNERYMFPTAEAVGKSTYKEEWVSTDDPEVCLAGTRLLDDTLIVSH